MEELTKQEWLDRCALAYDQGFCSRDQMRLLSSWLDFVMRLEHTFLSHGQSQGRNVLMFMNEEFKRTDNGQRTLANDTEGYSLIQLSAILSHHCQECATDPNAWWTRGGFCNHKEAE